MTAFRERVRGEGARVQVPAAWNALLDLLPGDGQLTVAEAAESLGVSQATIRRDLDQLARQQLVTQDPRRRDRRPRLLRPAAAVQDRQARAGEQRIGRAAAALVAPGAAVALNG